MNCLAEGTPAHELHRVVERAVLATSQFIHRDHGGVLELACDAGFLKKSSDKRNRQTNGAMLIGACSVRRAGQ